MTDDLSEVLATIFELTDADLDPEEFEDELNYYGFKIVPINEELIFIGILEDSL